LRDAFEQRYDVVTPANAIAFLAFDRDNSLSNLRCVRAAR